MKILPKAWTTKRHLAGDGLPTRGSASFPARYGVRRMESGLVNEKEKASHATENCEWYSILYID